MARLPRAAQAGFHQDLIQIPCSSPSPSSPPDTVNAMTKGALCQPYLKQKWHRCGEKSLKAAPDCLECLVSGEYIYDATFAIGRLKSFAGTHAQQPGAQRRTRIEPVSTKPPPPPGSPRLRSPGQAPDRARRHRGRCRRSENPAIAVKIRTLSHSPNISIRARSAGRGSNHRPLARRSALDPSATLAGLDTGHSE